MISDQRSARVVLVMTKIGVANRPRERKEGKVNVNIHNNDDSQNKVLTLQLNDHGEKVMGNVLVDTRDNWIGRFLYGGPIGLTVNFTLLIAITLHFVLTIGAKLEDELFYEKYFKQIWLRQFWQICHLLLPLHIVYTSLAVFVVLPLSRLSRSTGYYWLLGVSISSLMFTLLFTNQLLGIETMILVRCMAGVEWARMSMKVTSFLVECSRRKEVFDKSSIDTLLYFIFIPNLVYKYEYPRARRIRWVKVLSHIWWLWVVLVPAHAFVLPFLPYILVDITQVPLIVALVLSVASVFTGMIGFMLLNQFMIFENYCGLHGELMRYPDLETFGTPKETVQGTRGPHQININVSRWLKTYLLAPLYRATGSPFTSILCTFTVSYIFHDVVFTYMFGFSLLHISIMLAITHSLLMGLQAPNRFLQALHTMLFVATTIFWGNSYFVEYLARHYSSIPGAENESIFPLVPLSISVIIDRITAEVSF